MRYAPERHREIVAMLADGSVSVAAIAERLDVTTETVRRDLDVLQRRKLIVRHRGRAELRPRAAFELELAARHHEQSAEKVRIARTVTALLPADGVIGLDSGSMPLVCAEYFPRNLELTVVTNNLPAAQLLSANPSFTVLCLPGPVRGITRATVNPEAAERLRNLTLDLAIVGVNGVTADQGLTTTTCEEAEIKAAFLGAARRRVLPVISGKLGTDSFVRYGRLDELDDLVTDAGAPAELLEHVSEAGVDVRVV